LAVALEHQEWISDIHIFDLERISVQRLVVAMM
jgi:hypothetical protein